MDRTTFDEKVANSSETICDARFVLSQPVIVGDADVIDVLNGIEGRDGLEEYLIDAA